MRLGSALAALLLVLSAVGCSKKEIEPTGPIAREPLPSAPLPSKSPTTPAEPDPDSFAHVLVEGGRTFVVLHGAPEEERWARGAPTLVSDKNPVITRREIEPTALPASLVRRSGRPVRLFGAEGVVCEAKLGPLSMIGRVEPEFSVRQQWDGEDLEGNPVPPATAEQVAEEAWSMAEGSRSVVAELVEVRGDCKNALFARARDLAAPQTFTPRDAPASLAARAIQEMHTLSGYAEIDEMYEDSSVKKPGVPWEKHDGASPSVKVFSGDGATYVWLDAYAGMSCSDFQGKLMALWKLEGGPGKDAHFVKLYEGADDFSPNTLVHLDRDGSPSLLGFQSILRKVPHGFEVRSVAARFLYCPC